MPGYGGSGKAGLTIRQDLGKGLHDKIALIHVGMWNPEAWFIDLDVVIKQDIYINSAVMILSVFRF